MFGFKKPKLPGPPPAPKAPSLPKVLDQGNQAAQDALGAAGEAASETTASTLDNVFGEGTSSIGDVHELGHWLHDRDETSKRNGGMVGGLAHGALTFGVDFLRIADHPELLSTEEGEDDHDWHMYMGWTGPQWNLNRDEEARLADEREANGPRPFMGSDSLLGRALGGGAQQASGNSATEGLAGAASGALDGVLGEDWRSLPEVSSADEFGSWLNYQEEREDVSDPAKFGYGLLSGPLDQAREVVEPGFWDRGDEDDAHDWMFHFGPTGIHMAYDRDNVDKVHARDEAYKKRREKE